jgi:hypothetical protein
MTIQSHFSTVLRRPASMPRFDLPAHGLVSTLALFLFPENPTWVVLIQTGSHRRMAGRRDSAAEFSSRLSPYNFMVGGRIKGHIGRVP